MRKNRERNGVKYDGILYKIVHGQCWSISQNIASKKNSILICDKNIAWGVDLKSHFHKSFDISIINDVLIFQREKDKFCLV